MSLFSDPIDASRMPVVRIEGEPRILDTDLAERLGFAKGTKIRELIKRHATSLEVLGPLPTVGRVINGGSATEFYLNRKQAIFITAKSETPAATDITIEIIERFDAYERGAAVEAFNIPKSLPEALRLAADLSEKVEQQKATLAIVAPKAEVYDRTINADGLFSLREAAKISGIEPLKFNRWLFAEGYIYKMPGSSKWQAYQRHMQAGLFEHKAHIDLDADGHERVHNQCMVTPKGIMKLARKFGVELPSDLFRRQVA